MKAQSPRLPPVCSGIPGVFTSTVLTSAALSDSCPRGTMAVLTTATVLEFSLLLPLLSLRGMQ